MEPLVVVGGVAAGLGAILIGRLRAQAAAERRREEQEAQKAEKRRVQECGEAVHYLANNVGYMAREVMDREELGQRIRDGGTAAELFGQVNDRIEKMQALCLGSQPVGNNQITVKLVEKYRARHIYCVGKSGSGKTTLLRNCILQDLQDGFGIGVIAPEHEMLHEELLPFIPHHRIKDVVYVNPADTEYPIPINPLVVEEGEDIDLKADETMTILKRLFDEDGGGSAPRMDTILRQALYTLMQIPGTTLLDMEKLLDRNDATYREWAVKQIDDEQAEYFWKHTYPMYPRDAHLPISNRMGRFLRPKVVRNILCSPGRSLNIRQCMDEGKVLLFNLSDGILGESNAMLLGQLIVAKIQMAAMSRASIRKSERRPFYLYVDEFQSFVGVAATSYEKILSRARKYGLGLILAHQQTGQIPEHLMREILGNVSTVIAFNVSASDAKRLAREMVGEIDGEIVGLEPQQLLSLRIGQAFTKIDRNVFFMYTYPPPDWGADIIREHVTEYSRNTYGGGAKVAQETDREEMQRKRYDIEDINPAQVF